MLDLTELRPTAALVMPRGRRAAPVTEASPSASSLLPPVVPNATISSASFSAPQASTSLDAAPLPVAPILPRIDPQPFATSTQPAAKKRGRPSKAPAPPSPSALANSDTIDSSTPFTYPDLADTDTNPLLLPCYLPSLLSSPQLFQHVLHHFGLFGMRFAVLAEGIGTTSGTLSAVLNRKYLFKAIGVVKAIREWMSRRDQRIARLIATDIQQRWPRNQQQQPVPADESKDDMQTDSEQQPIDWEQPAFSKEAMEPLLAELGSGLKYGLLMDFLRHRMSVTKKQKVEDMLMEYIKRLEAEWDARQAAGQQKVKKEKAVRVKKESRPQQTQESALLRTSGRPERANSQHYYNEAALAGEEASDEMQDEDVHVDFITAETAEEAEDDEDSESEGERVKDEEEEEGSTQKKKKKKKKKKWKKSEPRASSGGGKVYSVNSQRRWVTRRPFQSPFSKPSWSLQPFVTHPFDAASYSASALSFLASSEPVTLQPFTSTLSRSSASSSSAAPSLLLHAGGSIDAMAWAPVGSPSVSPSTATHYLLVAPSNSKYRTYTPYSGKGVLCLWRVEQQAEATMALAIEHERGGVMDMRWYPQGVWQEEGSGEGKGRLGVAAVGFTDGSVVVFAVPHSLAAEAEMRAVQLASLPHVVLVPPPLDCRLSLPVPLPTSLAFTTHESPAYLAIGQSHSAVVVYALSCFDPASSSPAPAPSFHLTPRLGHQAVRGLTFSPVNPHQLLLATGQGDILLIDLRSPFHPVTSIPAHTSEPITSLHWLSSRPSSLLTSSRNRPRLHFLLHEAGDIRTLPLRGLTSLRSGTQRQDAGTCWSVDVLEDEAGGSTLAACGWSDGRVDLVGWRTADSELDKPHCRIRRLCWFGWARGDGEASRQLATGEGGSAQPVVSRARIGVEELDDERRVELSAVEMAMDEEVAVHHVQANLNVDFPRQFAVGGLAGIIRIQQVSDM